MSEAQKMMSAIELIVKALGPLDSMERHRAIEASLVVLGEKSANPATSDRKVDQADEQIGLPSRAQQWMRQGGLTADQLEQVFELSNGAVTVIAPEMTGKNNAEKTIKAYVLTGIAAFLSSGTPDFNDKAARQLCETLGCYDRSNHTRYLNEKANNFTGSKEKGWKLTAPGLKYGYTIVKELAGIG